jgi:phosphatidate cytidylyltransferase
MKPEIIKRILSSIILIPMALFFIIKGSLLFNFFISICFLITVYEWQFMTRKKNYNLIGLIFLIISFYSVYKLRNSFIGDYIYLLFVTIVCVSTDIGGYAFGKIFKGPRLTKISPKKTYSGMIGGFILSTITATIFFNNVFLFNNLTKDLTLGLFILVLLISAISQLGDIIVSYFKRLSKIKDTGRIIPGHGGLLDRIDGMIFAFPFSYLVFSTNIFKLF